MKRIYSLLILIMSVGISLPALAVTPKERDQARALAAKAYLRFANDGSGYLDEVKPSSMADLEKQLKTKEKENIKAFKNIPVPSGYEGWTKEQLADYWVKAFSTKGLTEKGRGGKTRARKYINEMTIAPAAAATPAETPAAAPAAEAPKPAEAPKQSPAPAADPGLAVVDSARQTLEKAEAIVENGIDETPDPQIEKVSNHTGLYVVILIVLVAVVIVLVVFASNAMKKNEANARKKGDEIFPSAPVVDDNGAINAMREKYAASLTAKNNEIAALSKKVEALTTEKAALQGKIESLTGEIAGLRSRLAGAASALEAAKAAAKPALAPAPTHTAVKAPAAPADDAPEVRSIYLGIANAKGIFIRADRSLIAGHSVYRLDTTDGYSGSYRVVNDPGVWEMGLSQPAKVLAGGCISPDLEATEGMSRIVTESAGTAIFENNCWRVLRKAKIRYE
ncbi:MAG: hypothetical protein K2M10_02310 [Muribaculaceae bacterium]|nr:hypothetical protein [Muribaculaceae bacterium]